LGNVPQKKNERSVADVALKIALSKLVNSDPYFTSGEDELDYAIEYMFDESHREYFSFINCFTEAIKTEGRILSFIHKEYQYNKLDINIIRKDLKQEMYIDNIFTISWWNSTPEIKTWKIDNRYVIEIRANEFAYHPPHFHVTYNEYSAVFKLSDGELYKTGKRQLHQGFLEDIRYWYNKHSDELKSAWNALHPVIF
jgi:hypothetical protein